MRTLSLCWRPRGFGLSFVSSDRYRQWPLESALHHHASACSSFPDLESFPHGLRSQFERTHPCLCSFRSGPFTVTMVTFRRVCRYSLIQLSRLVKESEFPILRAENPVQAMGAARMHAASSGQ